jgi:hypothetical protein
LKRIITETVREYNDQGQLIKEVTTTTESDLVINPPLYPVYPITPVQSDWKQWLPSWIYDPKWTTYPSTMPEQASHCECNAKDSESR